MSLLRSHLDPLRPRLLCLWMLSISLLFSVVVSYAAEQTPAFNPPWTQTRERVPQQVKDHENDTPFSWCPNQEKREFEVTYVDATTGTRTTIRRKEKIVNTDTGIPLLDKIVWDITVQEPGQPKKKTTYELQPPGVEPKGETRTERVGKEKPTTRDVRDGDLYDPKSPPKKGTWLSPPFFNWLVNASYREGGEQRFQPSRPAADFPRPLILAATEARSPSQGQGKVVIINLKIVTYGNPPDDALVHFDDGPQSTPEEFMDIPPTAVRWDPERDKEGPKTAHIPKDGWIPFTEIPGGGIYIGWGWTSTQVRASTLVSCSGSDDADELVAESRKLRDLADKADQGGPGFWDQRARQFDDAAKRAERDARGDAKRNAERQAKEARETAEALRQHNIPDKPDPKLPKPQIDKLNQERQAAIHGLRDEARDLLRRAQAILKDA